MQSTSDRKALRIEGFFAITLFIILVMIAVVAFKALLIPLFIIGFLMLTGFCIIQPNEAKTFTFFGQYVGTIRDSGFFLTIPFCMSSSVPLKIINFNTPLLKVNDLKGNPIEIGAVVVWRVHDAAQASFNVDNYYSFLANQSESSLRAIAAHYPYDSETEVSLRGNAEEIADKLCKYLQNKLSVAGITVVEVRITHLAYSPEIASAMLKRQQAEAIMQAREYIIMNALNILDRIIAYYEKEKGLKISDERKIDIINNLLVTFIADREASPVLNVGQGNSQ